uniref:Uncharacterized protein n=1 Tax=Daphnia galeata TaxID=27404 RepID=A0A8J2WL56_9CRUS|nr:unnamed protein product [Daphnia galeata]
MSVDFVKCFGAAGGLHNELSASVVESLVNDVLGYIKALGYSDSDSILRKIFHSALPTEPGFKVMLKSTSLKALVTLVMVSFILMASSPKATEARYLMTRSDPLLSPIGPPYGKDPRFDRLYDIITKLLQNGGGDLEYQIKSQLDNGP